MKKMGLMCCILASAVLMAACGATEETTVTEATTTTTAEQGFHVVSEETDASAAETTEPTGPVELTVDNFFDVDPAISEYGMSGECGDIIDLVNLDYLEQHFEDVYVVDSIEDLASVTYLVNAYPRIDEDDDGDLDPIFVKIDLTADIDLTGYDWVPLGLYVDYDTDWYAYSGVFAGNGHTITGLNINSDDSHAGFFGETVYCTVIGLYIEDATVTGTFSGVFSGYNGASNYIDCYGSGTLPDNFDEGEELFRANVTMNSNRFIDCSYSVTNGSGTLCENEFTVHQYDEGAGNALYEMFDPERDGVYEYTQDYFFD